ncbi:hypothetical protein [Paraclostridium sp. AKS73]|uniref:hypothetical protein n=1 Tax=Paraclostridium sp. AKS73 TaxID=2876116 RepID=UPI000B9EF8E2|nr:hypothetical protein [Paraclostridium sp. AKS73]MCU9816554.1 hypothetical protein [Paraclostridium sp. AKS73]OXX84132.1 hypothetical protein AVM15_06240 [Paraclostridium benzoelyticum]
MILWFLVIAGILILVSGIYFLVTNYRQGKYIKGYGLLAYTGFGMILLGGILLMETIFTSLPGNLSKTLPVGITMITCAIVGKLLLKPTFLRNKNKTL